MRLRWSRYRTTGNADGEAAGCRRADLDVHNFSLEMDKDLLWGISTQPTMIP